ncbi:MAG TPA: PBP1A family penicillin-binding protein [Candidatus Acidoferrales bacterium]|nr:PBP1A family penicillin-binding protein [Candidatus Acidoferrales bacterium]
MRIRLSRGFWTSRFGIAVLACGLLLLFASALTFAYYYVAYSRMIDARLSGQVFGNASQVYSMPRRIYEGEPIAKAEVASALERAGYFDRPVDGARGEFSISGSSLSIHPSPGSYFGGTNPLRVDFEGARIARIASLANGAELSSAEIEPELITNLFDTAREKRRVVRMDQLPKVLVDAVLAAEDKRFFEHPGFDPVRIVGAAWADLRHRNVGQGASTLTMQLARSLFFSTERTWKRKLGETLVALELEQRYSKQQLFELYANEIYLGNRGSFAIRGFGEGALAYFGTDVRELTLPEAAFLAGIIRAPNRYSSSDSRPDRAAEARDRVLMQMADDGLITAQQKTEAQRAPLHLARGGMETSSAPNFVDMVKDHLLEHLSESDLTSQSYRVYTTLDPRLEGAAVEAVAVGIKEVDALLQRRYERWAKENQRKGSSEALPHAQVALVALDPRTGEVRALVGGRDYGASQLNRALARRQPGSAFKPFVYLAAFDNAVAGIEPELTPLSTVVDEPTTFVFEGNEYAPDNFGEKFYGTVTLRDALTHSLNVATVRVAEMVGYQRVVDVVRQAGLDPHIQPTPAMALGAYEMTPLDVAAAYTVFANDGVRAEPMFIRGVKDAAGEWVERGQPRTREAVDPRAAYIVTNILQDVVNHGTGYPVRQRGFAAPAAGKTGTSHDGWFAGFTSNLICVIWVGFDDNRELGLAGGNSAAPIWAEFMKRAIALPDYAQVQDFAPPDGVSLMAIDPVTLDRATPLCPVTRNEAFLAGSEPTRYCELHGGLAAVLAAAPASATPAAPGEDSASARAPAQPASAASQRGKPAARSPQKTPPGQTTDAQQPAPQKKKSIWDRIFGIFGSGKKKDQAPG